MFLPFAVLLIGSVGKWEVMGKMFALRTTGLFQTAEYFKWIDVNIIMNLGLIGLLLSLMFMAFAREKIEDEFVTKIREQSLVQAVMINYALLFFVILFVFEVDFLYCVFANMYTILIIFVIKFNIAIHKSKKNVEK